MALTKVRDAVMPAGAVLQVVSATTTTTASTTGTSFVDAGLSASITPLSTSSKILVLVNTPNYCASAATHGVTTVFRGTVASGTNLNSHSNNFGFGSSYQDDSKTSVSACYLDSPSTTSATTYSTAIRRESGTGTVYMSINNDMATLVLMEIAG
jgi:hypothetical protein